MKTGLVVILIHVAAATAILAALLAPALALAGPLVPSGVPGTRLASADADDEGQLTGNEPLGSNPPYDSLILLRDVEIDVELWMPDGWVVARSAGSDAGADLVIVQPGQPAVTFSITEQPAGGVKTIFDLPEMMAAFDARLGGIPGTSVEWQVRWHRGTVRGFEALSTVSGADHDAVRWVCLRYQGTRQYWLVAAAPSPADFDANWFQFMAMMHSFRAR